MKKEFITIGLIAFMASAAIVSCDDKDDDNAPEPAPTILTVGFTPEPSEDIELRSTKESMGGNFPQLRVVGERVDEPYTVVVVFSSSDRRVTATIGKDFTFAENPIQITIPAGDYTTERLIPIPGLSILDDDIGEDDEIIILGLRSPSSPGLKLSQSGSLANYVIANDDILNVSFNQPTGSDREADESKRQLPQLSVEGIVVETTYTVEVSFNQEGSQATIGKDFTFQNPTEVKIPEGDYTTAKLFPIPGLSITNDSIREGDETILLELQNPSKGLLLLSDSTTTYTIVDDATDTAIEESEDEDGTDGGGTDGGGTDGGGTDGGGTDGGGTDGGGTDGGGTDGGGTDGGGTDGGGTDGGGTDGGGTDGGGTDGGGTDGGGTDGGGTDGGGTDGGTDGGGTDGGGTDGGTDGGGTDGGGTDGGTDGGGTDGGTDGGGTDGGGTDGGTDGGGTDGGGTDGGGTDGGGTDGGGTDGGGNDGGGTDGGGTDGGGTDGGGTDGGGTDGGGTDGGN